MMNCTRWRSSVTLVELMIAASVLAIAGVMLFLMFANCIILNEYNRERTLAVSHAQYVLEEMKNNDFTTLSANIGAGTWDWDEAGVQAQGLASLDNEVVDAGVVDIGAAGTPLLDVTVTVTWDDRRGAARNIVLETIIAEP